jgi:hypothetical protein
MFRIVAFLGLSILMLPLLAQSPSVELEAYLEKYDGKDAAFVERSEVVRIDLVDGKIQIESTISEERIYLNERAPRFSEDDISYSSFFEISDIKAYSQHPGPKKYKTLKVNEFKTKDVLEDDIFHDDVKEITFVYPELREGSKSYVQYKEKVLEPRFFGGFFFGSYLPVQYSKFEVIVHPDIEIEFKQFGMDSVTLVEQVIEEKGMIVHRFEANDLDAIEIEGGAPNIRYYTPHIIGRIKSYTVAGKKERLLDDVSDLYGWYSSLIKAVNQDHDPELVAITDSLLANADNELEKVKRIYYWVQDHIRYIAIENGLEGFVPRDAKTVNTNRYGDCKDMSSIITDMLDIAGIESHLTWIGTRSIPYSYFEVPTPATDNHMIATYISEDDEYYFLDATNDNNPFGYPTSGIQGKEALIDLGDEKFKVVKVREVDFKDNHITDTTTIRIQDGKITGEGRSRFSGYRKVWIESRLQSRKEDQQLKTLTSYLSKGSNKFLIDTFYHNNLGVRDKQLIVDYTFNVRDYHKEYGDEIYVNMILEKIHKDDKVQNDRKYAIERRYKTLDTYTVKLEIPENYTVSSIPAGSSYEHDKFGYSIVYKQKNNEIWCTIEFYLDHLILEKSEFEHWNKMIKELGKTYKQVLILKKK